ncbi:MAG: hypothetical protein ABL962_00840 [Fimbriimonadaceae bacterium]
MSALVQLAFSFGRDRDLIHHFQDELPEDVHLHDLRSDLDANRTWMSLSGEFEPVAAFVMRACELAFARINLQKHAGEHPRIGALDRCDWIGISSEQLRSFSETLAKSFSLPVFDKESNLRDLGFGGLLERLLNPPFGPSHCHETLGVTTVTLREFYVTIAATFEEEFPHFAQSRHRDIENRRGEYEPMFLGVKSLAYMMPSFEQSRLMIEFAEPDTAPPDPVLEWLDRRAKGAGVVLKGFEVVGALRQQDLLETRNVPIRPEQVFDELSLEGLSL